VLLHQAAQFKLHWELRIFLWFFNFLTMKVFGTSEWSFFLPTWVFSSSLSVIAYFILIQNGYSLLEAFASGLFVGSAPFEVFLGTVRANDLFFEWFLALAFLVLTSRLRSHILRGILLAILLWCAFYEKFWCAGYFLPLVAVYYWKDEIRNHEWKGITSFLSLSIALHLSMCLFWKYRTGAYVPFLETTKIGIPPSPVARQDLVATFELYPRMLFSGSEYHTTLFGLVPYGLIALLLVKTTFALSAGKRLRFDVLDKTLILFWGFFFLFTNFVSTSFQFDRYYSIPRIFRYLAPLSFPITLHAGKLAIDLWRTGPLWLAEMGVKIKRHHVWSSLLAPVMGILVILNIVQAAQATRPGRAYRSALMTSLQEIKRLRPPRVVLESWLSGFVDRAYRSTIGGAVNVTTAYQIWEPKSYEEWIRRHEASWEDGTVLITGLNGYVYYACYDCGIRRRGFAAGLSPNWVLYKEVGLLDYLPHPEPAALWILQHHGGAPRTRRI